MIISIRSNSIRNLKKHNPFFLSLKKIYINYKENNFLKNKIFQINKNYIFKSLAKILKERISLRIQFY